MTNEILKLYSAAGESDIYGHRERGTRDIDGIVMPTAKIKERADAAAQVSIGESACKPDDQTAIRYLIPLRPSGDFAAETNERFEFSEDRQLRSRRDLKFELRRRLVRLLPLASARSSSN